MSECAALHLILDPPSYHTGDTTRFPPTHSVTTLLSTSPLTARNLIDEKIMAPTPSTAAHKRSRPAFSPPRPGKKSKSGTSTTNKTATATKATKVTKKMGGDRVVKKSTSSGTRGKNGGTAKGPKQTPKQIQKQAQVGRRKAAAGTMRAILDDSDDDEEGEEDEEERFDEEDEDDNTRKRDQTTVDDSSDSVAEDDEEEDEDQDEDEDEDGDEDESRPSIHINRPSAADSQASSPEPEYMLAEVIHHDHREQRRAGGTSSKRTSTHHPSEPEVAIPLALIHHIMQSQFTTPDKTSLSIDARSLLGKYVDAFVREGIHRCALGRAERDKADGVGADVGDSGWLEVEDLERVAVQLCMDF